MFNFVQGVAGVLKVCIYVIILLVLLWVIWLVAKPLFKKQSKLDVPVKKLNFMDSIKQVFNRWVEQDRKRLLAEKEDNDKYIAILKVEKDKAFEDAMLRKARWEADKIACKRFGIPEPKSPSDKGNKDDVDLMNDLLEGEKVSKKEKIGDIMKDYEDVR
jgi:hypothetical protein